MPWLNGHRPRSRTHRKLCINYVFCVVYYMPLIISKFTKPSIYPTIYKKCCYSVFFLNVVDFLKSILYLLFITQGTVKNNVEPDHLACPGLLHPNCCRQPTLWLHALCLEALTVHSDAFWQFWAKAFHILVL